MCICLSRFMRVISAQQSDHAYFLCIISVFLKDVSPQSEGLLLVCFLIELLSREVLRSTWARMFIRNWISMRRVCCPQDWTVVIRSLTPEAIENLRGKQIMVQPEQSGAVLISGIVHLY
ncbi:unnamed protein product [Linum tenue]|uniref:Uncharacterized protein n=1 Tax=Linum tenue TaxID=586396 RepID=A0AAV0PIH4_9ROSI|nr:unnamed protein product [Linum tenue]